MKFNEKVQRKVYNAVGKVIGGLSQTQGDYDVEKAVTPGMPELLRALASECTVLLKNDGTLPFAKGSGISVFGRVQLDWFYVGYGSGGDVNAPYKINLIDGIRNSDDISVNEELADTYLKWVNKNPADQGFWGHWPRYYPEMPLTSDMVRAAADKTECALVVIGRSSGEDRENALEEGSFYLTNEERQMLSLISSMFVKTVVILNIGSIIDMSWLEQYKIGAALIVWQGGMESGNAVADVLSGKAEPSGRLSDTVARTYEACPSSENFGNKDYNNYAEDIFVGYRYFETFDKDSVLFPFGWGLGYTDFDISFIDAAESKGIVTVSAAVKNVGARHGKAVVQCYCEAPQGSLGKAARVLTAFKKTAVLAPDESVSVSLTFPLYFMSSYDDCGKTGYKSSYVLEKGSYNIYIGNNVRDARKFWSYEVTETKVLHLLSEISAPNEVFSRLCAKAQDGKTVRAYEDVPVKTVDLRKRIYENLPEEVEITGDKGYKLADVKSGKVTMSDFAAQLSLDELEAISRGDYTMNSSLGAAGNGGAFGGVIQSLRDKGIPPVITTDGPSGIRLKSCCSLLPIGTALACSWNIKLVCDVYAKVGEEMKLKGSDVLLCPGMNIHRNPLCGRNFEYFSEDPVLNGRMAAAVVSGVQSTGLSACPKHFVCNNQEYNRNQNDSRLSERALREIYLKGFEICVNEAHPKNIMTSYNKINGVWGHYNYSLCTLILRKEWGYEGNVMTDWWMRKSHSPEFPSLRDNAYRVRAQVDVLMPGGDRAGKKKPDGTLLETYGKNEGITLGEMQRSAINVLNFALNKL